MQKFLVAEENLVTIFFMPRFFLLEQHLKPGEREYFPHRESSRHNKSLQRESSRHQFSLLTRLSSLQKCYNLHNRNSNVTFF